MGYSLCVTALCSLLVNSRLVSYNPRHLVLFADNLFGDRLLNLKLFDRQLYKDQSAWYAGKAQKFGVPLDSRHLWTKVSQSLDELLCSTCGTRHGRRASELVKRCPRD